MMGTRLTAAILAFAALCVPIHASALNKEQLGCAARLVDPGDVSALFQGTVRAILASRDGPVPMEIMSAAASCAKTLGLSKEQEKDYFEYAYSDLIAAEARRTLRDAGFNMNALDRALEIGEGRSNPQPANFTESQWQAYEAALSSRFPNDTEPADIEHAFGLYMVMQRSRELARRKLS